MSNAEPRCPICRASVREAANTPFCSPVCRDRDLLNWLGEAYAVPGPPVDPDMLDRDADKPL